MKEEQGELSIKERSKLFVELLIQRKKHFARLRAEEKRRKPPTKAQKRNQMCSYLKNMASFTHNQLKNKSFKEVQKAFDKTMSRINSFVPIDKEVVEGNGKKAESNGKEAVIIKRPRKGLDEESVKRQKLKDDAEKEDLYKQDVLDLYRLVKERFKTTNPEGYDRLLWGDLKTLFEPSKEDEIWKNHQDYTLINWRLYDSCEIHLLLMDTRMSIHMLEEKEYPLTQEMLSRMLSGRLETLMKMRSEKPKEKAKQRGSKEKSSEIDKGKGKMVELEKPLKKKVQIKSDKEVAQRLQVQLHAELEEDESFKEVQKAFDKTMSQINSFVPIDKEVVEGNGKKAESNGKEAVIIKRARKGLDKESVKRQKLEDDAEKEDLYNAMLDDFDRQDVLDLYRLVKERFETTSPEGYDRLLWGDLMTLFEPSKEDEIWKNHQDYTLISWRLYDSCEIHLLLMDTRMSIHMLEEKEYPLTQEMLSRMLSGRLEVDHKCEMAYELIRFNKSQYKKLLIADEVIAASYEVTTADYSFYYW
uniref:Uncharacterized protein n=1 Tax=Tanacetum cinerariifolium TaxID=118510 RepID=A0A699IIL1_TANCI|nr:hypothetical protein [Tanacetum cinerariifolium]